MEDFVFQWFQGGICDGWVKSGVSFVWRLKKKIPVWGPGGASVGGPWRTSQRKDAGGGVPKKRIPLCLARPPSTWLRDVISRKPWNPEPAGRWDSYPSARETRGRGGTPVPLRGRLGHRRGPDAGTCRRSALKPPRFAGRRDGTRATRRRLAQRPGCSAGAPPRVPGLLSRPHRVRQSRPRRAWPDHSRERGLREAAGAGPTGGPRRAGARPRGPGTTRRRPA